jgi:hypothetical protein
MKKFTNFYDAEGQPINEGDILLNTFIGDLWLVEKENDIYYAYLIPSSGCIKHSENIKYPACTVELECIAETFKKIGNKNDNPELLMGLQYS